MFVRPAADMIIERNASYVDSSGALNLESLRAWGVTSSIAAVLGEMSTKFGETSPLRRRPTSLRPGAAAGGAGAGGAGLRYAATASEAAEAAKLRSSLTESLRAQLSEWYGRLVEALDEHETDGELLRSQLEQESREAAQATSRAEELEAYVAAVRAKVEAADAWLAENETGVRRRRAAGPHLRAGSGNAAEQLIPGPHPAAEAPRPPEPRSCANHPRPRPRPRPRRPTTSTPRRRWWRRTRSISSSSAAWRAPTPSRTPWTR